MVCDSSQPTHCLLCADPYYIDPRTKSCQLCAIPNCQVCQGQALCAVCKPAYYYLREQLPNGTFTTQCLPDIPEGYLPYLPSLFALNRELFPTENLISEIYQQSSQGAKSPDTLSSAVGRNLEPIFNVPWSNLSQGAEPRFGKSLIRLEVVPC